YDPDTARLTIEKRVSSAGGGWLVSWKDSNAVISELPDPKRFRAVEKYRGDRLMFYRITPATNAEPTVGSAPPWAGVTPAPTVNR
ncbi:hypothetical protein, partial [Candidatus Binatus sp.]|uniref:hypothetical protein n=1 Tax=Candidatus Binatus sp. TaxID=2811406 RepID=UPI003F978C54